MKLRRWLVVRTHNETVEILDRKFTERGAWRARKYWYTLQQAVGYRARLDVIHDER